MLKLSSVPFALAVLAGLSAVPSTAQAGVEYPWCAIYSERSSSGTNCGFSTYAQCRAAISGLGGICNENPNYAVAEQPRQRRVRRN